MKKLALIFLSLFSFAAIVEAHSMPARIIIVRHGEKIDDTHSDLSQKGCERAYQLPLFFETYRTNAVAIYAQQPKKAGGSIRPIETIAPTAEKFGLRINNSFLRDDVTSVANEILNTPAYSGKTVLVSWEHNAILNLVAALGIQLPAALQIWPSEIFDQAWIISFNAGKTPVLEIVAEHVLPTDIEASASGLSHWPVENSPTNNGIVVPLSVISECAKGNRGLDDIAVKVSLNPIPGL